MLPLDILEVLKEQCWSLRALRSSWQVWGPAFAAEGDIDVLPTRIVGEGQTPEEAVRMALLRGQTRKVRSVAS